MYVFKYFFSNYRSRTLIALSLLFLSAFVEGLSITAIIPLLANIIAERYGHSASINDSSNVLNEGLEKFNSFFEVFGGLPSTTNLLLLIAVGILVKSFIVYFARVYVGYTTSKIAKDMRLQLLKAISNVDWNYYVRQPSGVISSALMSETTMASGGYSHCVYLLSCIVQIIVYGIIAIFLSWKLAITIFILSAILIAILHRLISVTNLLGNENMLLVRSILMQLTDSLRNIKSLKSMGCQDKSDQLLYQQTKKLAKVAKRIAHSQSALISAQEPIITASIVIGIFVALQWLDIRFEVILVILIVLMRLMKTVAKAQKFYQHVKFIEGPLYGVLSSIDEASKNAERFTGTLSPTSWNELALKKVSFSHGELSILDGCELVIKKNQMTSIVGPSGAGKTTLIDLIVGLHSPQSGEIYIDDIKLRDINIKKWRQTISYVSQETTLFNTSIAYNVSLGSDLVTDQDIIDALKNAHAWEFIKDLPDSIHSEVGEQGAGLSGGQRQRILLARAFVRKPTLLILDEVTSALDQNTEVEICKTIKKVLKDTTIISISHRQALVTMSDVVFELKNKKLVKINNDIENILTAFPEPEILCPLPETILDGTTADITWDANNIEVSRWAVTAGTNGHGSQDIFNTGELPSNTCQASVKNLPSNGTPITISLFIKDSENNWNAMKSVLVYSYTEDVLLYSSEIDIE